MKKFLKVALISVFVFVVLALNVSAATNDIYELQSGYDYYEHIWYQNGTFIGQFHVTYDVGAWIWYDDAEVESILQGSTEFGTSSYSGYSYAEIINDYVDHYNSSYVDEMMVATREYYALTNIDDIYATYTHHNNAFVFNGVTQSECPVTHGVRN